MHLVFWIIHSPVLPKNIHTLLFVIGLFFCVILKRFIVNLFKIMKSGIIRSFFITILFKFRKNKASETLPV